jgi:hypothetical protein
VPASLKLQQQFGERIQVLFIESQGASATEAAAFALKQKWLGGTGIWTNEPPCDSGSAGLPSAVLLSGDGKVLFNGNPLDGHKEIMHLVDQDNAAHRAAPADVPKALEPAWAAFGKGKVGDALKLVDAIPEKDRPALGEAWQSTRDEFLKRTEASIQRAQWELDHGYPTRCSERLDQLAKACEGQAELRKSIDAVRANLAAPAGKAELEAAKVLDKLEAKFYESGGKEDARKDLERVSSKFTSTKVGARVHEVLAIGGGK